MHVSPSKPTLTETPGNTRPGTTGAASEKRDVTGLRASLSQQVEHGTVPLNNGNTRKFQDTKLKSAPLHNTSLTLSNTRESFSDKLDSSPDGKTVTRTMTESFPVATSSKVQVTSPPRGQVVEIPQSSCLKQGLPYRSMEPSEPRFINKLCTLH